ncbi:MAG: signal peptide peptidase SppA [Flavobacteriales bacterium Tduv]
MKSILKTALGTVLGIFLFLLILIGTMIILNFRFRSSAKEFGKSGASASVLQIKLETPVIEGNETESMLFYPSSLTGIRFKEIIMAIEKAKTDKHIKGICLELNQVEAGMTQLKDMRAALENFKKSKKFVYAYGQRYSQGAYYLGSAADSVFLNPSGGIEFKGLGIEPLFYKKLAEKFGVTFTTYRHGNYKSAIEPYIQENMSSESRVQSTRLLRGLWKNIVVDISQSRKIAPEKLNQIADELSGTLAELSYQNRLIDKLTYHDEFVEAVRKKLNIKSKANISFIPLPDYIEKNILEKKSNSNIAILYASGTIVQGHSSQGIQDETYKEIIADIKNNPSIKAVVLRINSPGGDALASENIYRELLDLKKEKPLIVSFGDQAASGGYYIALAGEQIIASPISVTGSIGVFGLIPDIKKLSEKLGITTDRVTTNANSIPFSPFNRINPQYKKMMVKGMERVYDNFINRVAKERKISLEQAEAVAQGQVWSGKEALKKGLIDCFGNLDDAIKIAAEKAKIQEYTIMDFPKKRPWSEVLKNLYKTENLQEQIKKVLNPGYSNMLKEIQYLKSASMIQARAPFKVSLGMISTSLNHQKN